MKILLPVDGSPCSLAAVAEVCRRPWPPATQVRVITVDTPISDAPLVGVPSQAFDEITRKLRGEAQRHLDEAMALLRRDAPLLAVTSVLREGRAKDVILDEASQWGSDLIVVGSHGHGALRRLFLGSVSLALATNAPCSVEIVRTPAPSLGTDAG